MDAKKHAGATTAALGAVVLFAPGAEAATFEVTTTSDPGPGSLRQAIADANGTSGVDTITFAPSVTGTIALTGGQLAITEGVTVQGPGADRLTIDGGNASRVLYAYTPVGRSRDVTISGLAITGGAATLGAGIANFDTRMTLEDVDVSGNAATGDGGGVWSDGFNGFLRVRDSRISGNTAGSDGGGVYVEDSGGDLLFEDVEISGNSGRRGGGIYFYDPDNAVTLQRVAITQNTASQGGGGLALYDTDGPGAFRIVDSLIAGNTAATVGGGVQFQGPDSAVEVVNSTISGNAAASGGGVVFEEDNAARAITASTIAGNAAPAAANVRNDEGTLTVRGSAVADAAGGGGDLGGAGSFDATGSLVEDAGAATVTGAPLTGDPQLGALADNGGPTLTHLPAATSPLIDAGPALGLATDQRGVARPQHGTPDIGAAEREPAITAVSPAAGPAGTPVTITGTLLSGATEVRFGAATATFTQAADGTITAIVPSGAAGSSPITVVSLGSPTPIAGAFTTTATPAAPATAPTAPATPPAATPPVQRKLVCARVPKLTGYTTTMARRVLAKDGCANVPFTYTRAPKRLSAAAKRSKIPRSQWVPKPFKRSRIVSQTPKPGTPLYEGDTIRVVVRAR